MAGLIQNWYGCKIVNFLTSLNAILLPERHRILMSLNAELKGVVIFVVSVDECVVSDQVIGSKEVNIVSISLGHFRIWYEDSMECRAMRCNMHKQ